jgi:hypothetical protein
LFIILDVKSIKNNYSKLPEKNEKLKESIKNNYNTDNKMIDIDIHFNGTVFLLYIL